MSYSLAKRYAGQEVVKKITIKLNKCKFCQSAYEVHNVQTFNSTYSSGYTGVVSVIVDALSAAGWQDSPFYVKLVTGGTEIVKMSWVSGVWTILARGVLGTAAQSLSGDFKMYHLGQLDGSCYGYSQTCSDAGSYQAGLYKDLVFATASLPVGQIYHAGAEFKNIKYDSSEVKVGETIGTRSSLQVKISDQVHNDYDTVYYADRRTSSGTMLAKLLARHPFLNGRPITYSVGFRTAGADVEPEWETREFIIDKANLDNGILSISALDPLILTEGKKAKMPLVSTAQLTTAITSESTSLTFGNALANYFGTSGNVVVRIDSELILVTANGTTTMTIVTRGYGKSAIKDHSINATVQNCIVFTNVHVVDAITYALTTWTTMPSSYIDSYATTIALIPNAKISSYILSSAIDVVTFINYCIFLGNLVFYFDDVTKKIVIKYVTELTSSPIVLNEDNHIGKGSFKKDSNFGEWYTRFTMMWAPYDKTKESDDSNFQLTLTGINTPTEGERLLGEINERKVVKMPLLTESTPDYQVAAAAINRVVSTINPPEIVTCDLDVESVGATQGGTLELGSIVTLNHKDNQNVGGTIEPRLYQVMKISGDPWEAYTVKMKRYQSMTISSYDFAIEAGTYINYVLTTALAAAGVNISTPREYLIYVKIGAIFGSSTTATAAFRTGTPPAGVTFKFIAKWEIYSQGGDGGLYPNAGPQGAGSGFNGGAAFEANCNCVIDNAEGIIWAGGGGGGGGSFTPYMSAILTRGGGGQGWGTSLSGGRSGGFSSAGVGGPIAGNGGTWGTDGADGNSGYKGYSGYAVRKNGFTVNIIAGNNSLAIKGTVG